ncbi:hypothetical protein GQ43DRAFT_152600 [Delitschia confertaspora ATCC 74209]|uniref:Uncharacterized protein n=1 Tax=Delitschia confertaspora ATCC 74209 TaxID=1513339 RepID=A0A9P4MVW9_9PLEO|nr:hypothetical protein GQ43DRAFT_152600 [Delitschia confertaspora ATCC 74209]
MQTPSFKYHSCLLKSRPPLGLIATLLHSWANMFFPQETALRINPLCMIWFEFFSITLRPYLGSSQRHRIENLWFLWLGAFLVLCLSQRLPSTDNSLPLERRTADCNFFIDSFGLLDG